MFNANAILSELNLNQLLPPLPRRTDLVTYVIKINGTAIPDTVSVHSIAVTHVANKVSSARIVIIDGDAASQRFATSDLDILSPGSPIEIALGYHGEDRSVFKGIIVRHTVRVPQQGTAHIEVLCKHISVKLTVGRYNRYFFDETDSDIIKSLARGKVTAEVADTSFQHPEMVQYGCTDWDFLVTRAEANGLLVIPKGDKLLVKVPDFDQEAKFTLNHGTSIVEFEAEMDARDQYPDVQVTTWDPSDQRSVTATPSQSGGGGFGGMRVPSIPTGPIANIMATAAGALGLRLPNQPPNTDYTRVMGWAHFPLQHTGQFANEEAQVWAQAQDTKQKLAKQQGRIKFAGVADIHPGDCLQLVGVGQRHSGKVFVTAVTHDVGDGLWSTHAQFGLSAEWHSERYADVQSMPAAGLLPAIEGLQIGVVTSLEDPDRAFRIQVRLPLIDARGRGVWVRLATQDAGDDRGACWRPEIGDEVIVGFFNNDPRQGVILGSLHSTAKAAPLPAQDTNHKKGWTTRSGMHLLFDDEKKSVLIDTPAGKKIRLDEDAGVMEMQDEHGNKILFNSDGIVIESGGKMTLKAAQKMEVEALEIAQKAQTTYKVEAQSQAQVQSTGDLVLKGTFVRIN